MDIQVPYKPEGESGTALKRLIKDPRRAAFYCAEECLYRKSDTNLRNCRRMWGLSRRWKVSYLLYHTDVFDLFFQSLGVGATSSISIVLGPLDRPGLEASGITQVH